ncbi:MAG: hypothetical protein JWN89_214 [Parcubacteria group bacterium]|nr:hypothetical protein [Parcubacteria group bacterium]
MSHKKPVLTATVCRFISMISQAVEVLTGERVYLAQYDFNTGYGSMIVGNIVYQIGASLSRDDLIHFHLVRPDGQKIFYTALFEEGNVVKVGTDKDGIHQKMTIAGKCSLRWVGTTKDDRREEPLYLRQFEYCAQVRGMTLDELLRTEV